MRSLFLLLFVFGISFKVTAKDDLVEFYKHFKKGEYQDAQVSLGKIPYKEEFEPTRYYLLALTFKYLQQYDLALPNFKKSIKLGNKKGELFFEYGQSLFALNELEAARRAFKIAFAKNFKKPYSLYYIAHIGELLEDHSSVKTNYVKILKDPESDIQMKQVSYLRLAELIYERTKNKFYVESYIADYIVPLLNRGRALDPKSDTASEILARYDEILLKQNMHPLLLENGRLLSRQGTNLFFTQEFQVDNNVALESDLPTETNETTDISSLVSNSELFYSKRYIGGKYFVLTPELRINFSHYFNRENSAVFQNDSYSFAPALRGSYNFSWNKKRAEFLYEFDYNYTARDHYEIEERKFYGRSTTFSLGFRRKFFDRGDTTLKFRKRTLDSFSEDLTGSTTSFYGDQLWVRENGHIIVGIGILDLYRPNNELFATDSLLLRGDYLIPRAFWGVDLNLSLSSSFLDTKEQSDERGIERLISGEIRLQKRYNSKLRYGLAINFLQNTSKDEEDFSYSRTIMSAEVRYSAF